MSFCLVQQSEEGKQTARSDPFFKALTGVEDKCVVTGDILRQLSKGLHKDRSVL